MGVNICVLLVHKIGTQTKNVLMCRASNTVWNLDMGIPQGQKNLNLLFEMEQRCLQSTKHTEVIFGHLHWGTRILENYSREWGGDKQINQPPFFKKNMSSNQ